MKIKNYLKKITSTFLILVTIVSNIPLNIVFANLQSNILNLNVISENEVGSGYSMKFIWENPEWSILPDGSATNGDIIHTPDGFKLYEKRVAPSSNTFNAIKDEKGANTTSMIVKNLQLTNGNIYEYKIVPYHSHSYISNNGTTIFSNAPMDTSTPEETVIFMTDIEVEATGEGNSLVVTFDNPQYEEKDIFTGYRIYYQKGGSNVSTFHSQIDVDISDSNLIRNIDPTRNVQRLSYKISSSNILPGEVYAVKVEPLYNKKEIRDSSILNPSIEINKVKKMIGFNSQATKEYRTNNAYVSIRLNVLEDGKDYLKLKWGDLSNIANTIGNIQEIRIYSGDTPTTVSNIIGTIYSFDAVNINTWRVPKPKEKVYYQIKIKFSGMDNYIYSEMASYSPDNVNITPNKPYVYLKSSIEANKSIIDMYWEAFLRYPYMESENSLVNENGMILDKNILYDIWVTDSGATLNAVGVPKIFDKINANDLEVQYIKDTKAPVYNKKITSYVTINSNGEFVVKPIEQNKVYYIKIVAIKPVENSFGLESEPSEVQIYVPANGNISKPNSLSKPPLSIKKDENGNELITETEATLQWYRKWYEVYDTVTEKWYTKVAIRNGNLIFGSDIKGNDKIVEFYNKNSEEEARLEFANQGYTLSDSLIIRNIDINSDTIKYELLTIKVNEINQQGGFEAYLEKVMNSEEGNWKEINPDFLQNIAEYTIKELEPNTSYAFLLRPYRILDGNKKDAYPTYILATTKAERPNLPVKPVVPILNEFDKSDFSIEVFWNEISNNFIYELAIDEVIVDDVSKAKRIIKSEDILKDSILFNKEDKIYIKYNIDNLFPSSGYYIWIRAIEKDSGESSDWSTPLYSRTDNIKAPNLPIGFGLASQKSLEIYNNTNKTDYKPSSDKYLVFEWFRDSSDTLQDVKVTEDKDKKVEALLDPNIKETYLAKFNNLIPNKEYYTRVKTRLTALKTSSEVKRLYSYIIQLSPTQDFKDAIEFEIPSIESQKVDKKVYIDSEWTQILKFKTKYSEGDDSDYDGNVNDKLYPLPSEDFEISYDGVTQTLIYRFRSNKKSEFGENDNLADQRFITKLINEKIYTYTIDLTSHLGYKIKTRTVEIPYTVLSAFNERKIALSLIISGTKFRLNPGFLDTLEVKSIGNFSTNTTVKINISENPLNMPILNYNQVYATTPQNIMININNNGIFKEITSVGKDMDIDLKLKDRTLNLDSNVLAYRNIKGDSNKWNQIPSIYNQELGVLKLKAAALGTYTTIATSPKANETGILAEVNSQIELKGLENTNLNNSISVLQFNNILAGIGNGSKQINVNDPLSTKDFNSLKRSGMLLQGSVVGREYGLSSLVKLYEIKTKQVYQPISNVNNTTIKDINKSNVSNRINLIKAQELGFLENDNYAKPKDVMTINQVLYIINIILQDSI